MRQRPRDPEPQAGRRRAPRPREVRPHWIDRLPLLTYAAATAALIGAAAAQGR